MRSDKKYKPRGISGYSGVTAIHSSFKGKKTNNICAWQAAYNECINGKRTRKYIGQYNTANKAAMAINDYIIANNLNKNKLNVIINDEFRNKPCSGGRTSSKFYNSLSKDEIIERIKKNTKTKNKEDNDNIIKWLNGDNNSIWNVLTKYKKYYSEQINICIKRDMKKNMSKKYKESAITIEDIVLDFNIYLLDKIKTGRFDGRFFQTWSVSCCRNYFTLNFMVKKELSDCIEVLFN